MTIDRRSLPRVSNGRIGVEIGHTISSDWRFFNYDYRGSGKPCSSAYLLLCCSQQSFNLSSEIIDPTVAGHPTLVVSRGGRLYGGSWKLFTPWLTVRGCAVEIGTLSALRQIK